MTPPDAGEAVALAEELCAQLDGQHVLRDWLAANVDPRALPGPLTEGGLDAWEAALAPQTGLSQLLRTQPVIGTVATGPDYVRVVFDTEPRISVVVRSAEQGPQVDALNATTCGSCSEPERFVRDLLWDVQNRGGDRRLMPGVELAVGTRLGNVPGNADTRWVSAWMHQRGGKRLGSLLEGAAVQQVDESLFTIALADSKVDTWNVLWRDQRWQIAYDDLAEDSPLRLSTAEASSRRRTRPVWTPAFQEESGVVVLGEAVIGLAIEPLTDTVLLAILDVDGTYKTVARVDPHTQTQLATMDLPDIDTQAQTDAGWFGRWKTALSASGQTLTVSIPNRVVTMDTRTGRAWTVGGQRVIALSATDAGPWISDANGPVRTPDGHVTRHSTGLVGLSQDGSTAISSSGDVVFMMAPEAPPLASTCAGDARGAALSPDGQMWAVACGPESGLSIAFVGVDGTGVYSIRGEGSYSGAVAWSPTGARVAAALGPQDALALFNDQGTLTHRTGQGVHQIAWSLDGSHLATAHDDGLARWRATADIPSTNEQRRR
ncbi:MAG: WD40 repeat protein [Myxococcota bacterium]